MDQSVSRRTVLTLVAATVALLSCDKPESPSAMAKVAPFVKPKENWSADHFFAFLSALPPAAIFQLKKSQNLIEEGDTEADLKSPVEEARLIQKQLVWLSSNVFTYLLSDPTKASYHNIVVGVAKKAEIDESIVAGATTFELENKLFKLLFAQLWDKLTPYQRSELLQKIDPNESIKDKAALTVMGGASVIALLSSTVAFTGFAFYTTMSITIASVASAVGVSLPFGIYAGASTIVGILSGPVGWAIAGVTALGVAVFATGANLKKTAELIVQIHALKIEALRAAGVDEREIFGS